MRTNGALAVAERSADQATDYLVNDDFTTALTFGAVNGSSADPGPGRRVAIDTGSKLYLGGEFAVINGSAPSSGDPIILYRALPRTGGRVLVSQVNMSGTTAPARVGFNISGFAGSSYLAIFFNSSGVISATIVGTTIAGLGAWSASIDYRVAVILRAAAGIAILIKGGAFTNWTLLVVSDLTAGTTWYPCIAAVATGSGFVTSYVRVPTALWLPIPLVSDGFSAWGSSDGRGHAEGVAGIYGSGGDGKAWTASLGTWGASGGVASATALSGGAAIATADAGKADLVAAVSCTLSAGTMSLIVRYVDNSNFIHARRTLTNVQIVKVVAGAETIVQDTTVTLVAGAQLVLIAEGTKFRCLYNNTLVGAEQTIADAGLQSATKVGLRTSDITNTFDSLIAYARGSGGEHSALDAF